MTVLVHYCLLRQLRTFIPHLHITASSFSKMLNTLEKTVEVQAIVDEGDSNATTNIRDEVEEVRLRDIVSI